jgi:hypothetical protein
MFIFEFFSLLDSLSLSFTLFYVCVLKKSASFRSGFFSLSLSLSLSLKIYVLCFILNFSLSWTLFHCHSTLLYVCGSCLKSGFATDQDSLSLSLSLSLWDKDMFYVLFLNFLSLGLSFTVIPRYYVCGSCLKSQLHSDQDSSLSLSLSLSSLSLFFFTQFSLSLSL